MKHLAFRGLAAFSAAALFALVSVTAFAQPAPTAPAPAQVIQGSDGILYLLVGGKAWTLVPGQASDDAVSSLALSGEIDSTIPMDVLIAPAPQAPPASLNEELMPVSKTTCRGVGDLGKLSVSLASVDRQAGGLVWHVSILNHASIPTYFRGSNDKTYGASAYMLAGDGTKYGAHAIDDTTVAIEERKALDLTSEGAVPAGDYRLFVEIRAIEFGTPGVPISGECDGAVWSSAPVSLR